MKWSSRYQPIDDERTVQTDRSPADCRALLELWCERTKARGTHTQTGLAVKRGRGDLYRVYFQYDSPEETRYYYYKKRFLFVWLVARVDGGCEIHYRRVVDRWSTQMARPAGALLIVAALIWLFIMRATTQAWVFLLAMVMIWAGVWMMIPTKELVGQGVEVIELLERRLAEGLPPAEE